MVIVVIRRLALSLVPRSLHSFSSPAPHTRSTVSYRGRENSLPMWHAELPWELELRLRRKRGAAGWGGNVIVDTPCRET